MRANGANSWAATLVSPSSADLVAEYIPVPTTPNSEVTLPTIVKVEPGRCLNTERSSRSRRALPRRFTLSIFIQSAKFPLWSIELDIAPERLRTWSSPCWAYFKRDSANPNTDPSPDTSHHSRPTAKHPTLSTTDMPRPPVAPPRTSLVISHLPVGCR